MGRERSAPQDPWNIRGMRLGIFGGTADAQTQALVREATALGVDSVIIEGDALERGEPLSFEDGSTFYRRECLDDVHGFFLRFVPLPHVQALERDDELVLYEDWYVRYMQSREHSSVFLAWLLQLQHRGALLVNPPQAASVLQLKPFQLEALRSVGAAVPRTLISNDPERVRAFHAQVKDVIYKPVMGGALTRRLDEEALEGLEALTGSPVIFQERAPGDDLRVMLVGEEIVSSVAIVTPEQHLDFRADPTYSSGEARYREVKLPAAVEEQCRKAARLCGLHFAGIDIKHQGDRYVFLELNSSPLYYDVEHKLGHPITAALARYLVEGARSSRFSTSSRG
jgi:glutathione synthase/RimK-type ligase-like ATP-grasp enzyme